MQEYNCFKRFYVFHIVIILGWVSFFVYFVNSSHSARKGYEQKLQAKERQIEILEEIIKEQKRINLERQEKIDTLLQIWEQNPKEIIIEKIVKQNEAKRTYIRNATNDELLRELTGILQEEK